MGIADPHEILGVREEGQEREKREEEGEGEEGRVEQVSGWGACKGEMAGWQVLVPGQGVESER